MPQGTSDEQEKLEAAPGTTADPTARLARLEDLSAALRQRPTGIAFDIDDTLTLEGRLTEEAFGAMWRAARAGVVLVAATGRPAGWAEVWARQWPVAAVVAENGACWVADRPGEGLCWGYAADSEMRAGHRQRALGLIAEVRSILPKVRLSDDHHQRRCDVAFDIGERANLGARTVERLRALIEEAGARALVSSVHAHAQFGVWDKASGLVAAAEALGLGGRSELQKRWVYVGDSANDAAAFAFFSWSVGVANVRSAQGLEVWPRFATGLTHGRGFAELVDVLLSLPPRLNLGGQD